MDSVTHLRRDAFEQIKRSTVAIVHLRDDLLTDGSPLSSSATLLGSGFFIDEWTVATCHDVLLDYAATAHRYGVPDGDEPPFPYVLCDRGTTEIAEGTKVTIVTRVTAYKVLEMTAASNKSIAILRVAPPVGVDSCPPSLVLSREACEEGDELIVCGFPLGLNLQHADGAGGIVLNSSFSRAMVSSALPYRAAPPGLRVYFQVDGMTDVGQRGGPVFDPHTGLVYGIFQERKKISLDSLLAAMQIPVADHEPDVYGVPLGLGRGIHSHQVLSALEKIQAQGWRLGEEFTLAQMRDRLERER